MRDLAVLFLHLLATVARLAGPGGAREVVAGSSTRLLILNRSRKRSPSLRPSDRVVVGLCALFMRPGRLMRSAIVLKPSTARLEKEKATDDERRVFIEVIAQAIQGDPALALPKYERDKVELQKVLRSEFAGTAYAPTEPLAPKFSFLSLVHF